MKKIFFFAFIYISQLINAQTSGCLPLQKGKFSMTDDQIGTTYITRTKKYQIEESPKLGIKARYDITWLSECIYELKNMVFLEGTGNEELAKVVVTVEITKVNLKSYNVKVSTNIDDKTFDGVVDIVK